MKILKEMPKDPPNVVVGIGAVLLLLSASCCVLPIGLSIIGLGGSWLVLFGPFVAYRPLILIATGLLILWAWKRILRPAENTQRKPSAVYFASFATLCFIVALSSPLWEAAAAKEMWSLWRITR